MEWRKLRQGPGPCFLQYTDTRLPSILWVLEEEEDTRQSKAVVMASVPNWNVV